MATGTTRYCQEYRMSLDTQNWKGYFATMPNKAMEKTVPQAQFVVNTQGKKAGVLLSLKQYQKLLEDLHDLAVIAERRDEESISLEEMQRRSILLQEYSPQ